MSKLLEIEDLTVAYGKAEVVHGVTLSVAAGEFVALLGRNGAGKTTTLHAASGLIAKRGGVVRFDGQVTTFVPDSAASAGIAISDADIRSYYDGHHDDLTRRGRAVISLLAIPRTISHADSAATLAHLLALRQEIENVSCRIGVHSREHVGHVVDGIDACFSQEATSV